MLNSNFKYKYNILTLSTCSLFPHQINSSHFIISGPYSSVILLFKHYVAFKLYLKNDVINTYFKTIIKFLPILLGVLVSNMKLKIIYLKYFKIAAV